MDHVPARHVSNDFARRPFRRVAGFHPLAGRFCHYVLYEWSRFHNPADLCVWFTAAYHHAAGQRALDGLDLHCFYCCPAPAVDSEQGKIVSGVSRAKARVPKSLLINQGGSMKKSVVWKLLALMALASMLVTACSGGAKPAATEAPASKKVTSTGYECPEPNPRVQVTSKELNLFVWTEYIPPDVQECFELVYGIKVNRDEYSANEEMYAKLSAGGTSYDLVQPTDYIVSLMVRQGLLQKLDKSKLTVMGNFDPNYLNLSFDPGNEYTIPYQAGTDAIVYNADKVKDPPKSWSDLWKPEYAGKM